MDSFASFPTSHRAMGKAQRAVCVSAIATRELPDVCFAIGKQVKKENKMEKERKKKKKKERKKQPRDRGVVEFDS